MTKDTANARIIQIFLKQLAIIKDENGLQNNV